MERNILSKSEDEYFSTRVEKYNNSMTKDEKERAYIKKRTEELVWKIMKEKLMASDDLISGVYISIHTDIDRIIAAYRIAGSGFNHYLKQVCIYRIRRVRHKEIVPFYLDYECCEEIYHDDVEEKVFEEMAKDKREKPLFLFNPLKYSNMTMKEVIEYIVKKNDREECSPKNEKEKAVRNKLENDRLFRRNFLFFILSLPFSSDEDDASNYARLFRTDENAFSRLLYLKNEIITRNSKNRERNIERANKHWALMAKIKNSMYKASSREEYSALKDNYLAQVRCHRKRLNDIKRSFKGIVHEEIASVVGQSRATVTMGIKNVKETLKAITTALPG